MGTKKKLSLALLVSVLMAAAFAIGLLPMAGQEEPAAVGAAPVVTNLQITADGVTPVGESFSVPVAAEQRFSVLDSENRLLPVGAVQWSLASDGVAVLDAEPGSQVASIRAAAAGKAALFVSTADGAMDWVGLSFYALKAAQGNYPPASDVAVDGLVDGARVFTEASGPIFAKAAGVPLTLTTDTDSPGDISQITYTVSTNKAVQNLIGNGIVPFPATLDDISDITTASLGVTADTYSGKGTLQGQPVNFSVETITSDANGDGLPDDPFGIVAEPAFGVGDKYVSAVSVESPAPYEPGTRNVIVQPLAPASKAAYNFDAATTVAVQDPGNPLRVVSISIPDGLLQAGEEGILVLEAADNLGALLGTEVADLTTTGLDSADFATISVEGTYYIFATIWVKGATDTEFAPIDQNRIASNPIHVEFQGVNGVAKDDNCTIYTYPADVDNTNSPAVIDVTAASNWTASESDTVVLDGIVKTDLTHLSVIAPFKSPDAMVISAVANQATGEASDYAIGGATLDVTVDNVPAGQEDLLTISLDGVDCGAAVRNGSVYTVTVPRAKDLSAPATDKLVDVKVETQSGVSDTRFEGFQYLGPKVDSINPTQGGEKGGTLVTVDGEGFDEVELGFGASLGGAEVDFNTAPVKGVTQFQALTGVHAPGLVDLNVSTGNNYTGSLLAAFNYLAAPALNIVSPNFGPTAGNTAVGLYGANYLVNGFAATFDGVAAALDAIEDTYARVYNPAHAAGFVDVTVTTDGGVATSANGFLYINGGAPQPVVDDFTPKSGTVLGGTGVVIDGDWFLTALPGDLQVTFDGVAATINEIYSIYRLYVTTPAHARGPVDVVVTTAGGTVTASAQFTYLAEAPVLQSVDPATGPAAGGNTVTITGTNLFGVTDVTFGGVAATDIVEDPSGTQITVTAPAGAQGTTVDVSVTAEGGTDVLAQAYTYRSAAPITAVFPSSVFDDGGYQIEITGDFSQIAGTPQVSFQALGKAGAIIEATDEQLVAADTLIAKTPVAVAGDYDLFVTAATKSGRTKAFTLPFTFVPLSSATITGIAVDPTQSLLAGGVTAVVTGSGFPVTTPQSVPSVDPITDGQVIRVGGVGQSAPIEFHGANGSQITVPIYLYRNSAQAAASNLEFNVTYDASVLQPVTAKGTKAQAVVFNPSANLTTWYQISGTASELTPGDIQLFFLSLSGKLITTIDDQRGAQSTNAVENPFHLGDLVFNVIGANGATTYVEVSDLLGSTTPPASDPTDFVGQRSWFNVGETQIPAPTTPEAESNAVVYFGTQQASIVKSASKAGPDTELTVTVPAGARLGLVDVRVEQADDSLNFGIAKEGFEYVDAPPVPVINTVAPAKNWLFGGGVVHLQGTNFSGNDSVVTFGGVPAALAEGYTNTNTDLYVTAPVFDAFGATVAEYSVEVAVQAVDVEEPGTAADAFTYVRYNATEQSGGMPATVYTTAFIVNAAKTQYTAHTLFLADDTTATLTLPSDILSSVENTAALKNTPEVTALYGLARATKSALHLGLEQDVPATIVNNVWAFDLHLYDQDYAEREVSINTDQTAMKLTYPTNDALLLEGAIATGGTSAILWDSTLTPDNVDVHNYTVGDTAMYQSTVSPGEYAPESANPMNSITQVNEVTSRLYNLGAFVLYNGAGNPNPAAALSATSNTSGPTTGGTLVTIVGQGLGWPQKVTFGGVEADLSTLQNVSEFGFQIEAPANAEGVVDIVITVQGGEIAAKALVNLTIPGAFTYTKAGFDWGKILTILGGLLAALLGLAAGGGDSGGGGGGPCFIATAAYGTPLAGDIETLRVLRDSFLLNNALGTALVDVYYHVSPAIADVIAKHSVLAAAVRVALLPVILMAKLVIASPVMVLALGALSAVLATVRMRKAAKKA